MNDNNEDKHEEGFEIIDKNENSPKNNDKNLHKTSENPLEDNSNVNNKNIVIINNNEKDKENIVSNNTNNTVASNINEVHNTIQNNQSNKEESNKDSDNVNKDNVNKDITIEVNNANNITNKTNEQKETLSDKIEHKELKEVIPETKTSQPNITLQLSQPIITPHTNTSTTTISPQTTQPDSTPKPTQQTQPTQSVNDMSPSDQINHYKTLCLKTKKLAAYLDNENKELKTEKNKLLNKIASMTENLKSCGIGNS